MKRQEQKKSKITFDELDSWLAIDIDGGCLACIDWLQVEQSEKNSQESEERAV